MSKLFIAAAGAGKTTFLINDALKRTSQRILFTTFTDTNTEEIRKKFYEMTGCIPSNIKVLPWFSFLLTEGVRPYQSYIIQDKITGICLTNTQSKLYVSEDKGKEHYLARDNKVLSDKLSKLAYKIDEKSNGIVFQRLKKIYDVIYIDEAQDLVGYDLEIIKALHQLDITIIMAADPRQVTFETHMEQKNKKYKNGKLKEYIKEIKLAFEIDEDTLVISHRNNSQICNLANKLYPQYKKVDSDNNKVTGHDGIFFVGEEDVNNYCKIYKPTILRYNKSTKIIDGMNLPVLNYGLSKGLTFDRTLIYPTEKFLKALFSDDYSRLENQAKARCYVAITRAKYSVAFVIEKAEYTKFRDKFPSLCWGDKTPYEDGLF
ncbi:ATP-dependent helicase [Acidaminococcus sp. DS4831]|uniref:ATP-dependent helicase n=1 Tax=Acidaminococcus sp. DS4831 TaxID=3141399 RepID=UPI0032E50DE2